MVKRSSAAARLARRVADVLVGCVLAVGLIACSGGSSDAGEGSPTTESTTPTATTATTATATATSDTSQTGTVAPTLAPTSDAPLDVDIDLEGDGDFVAQATAALELLARRAPEALQRIDTHIATMRSVEAGSGMDVFTQTYNVGDVTAFAPGYSVDQQVLWFAGTIAHDACHSELFAEGETFAGKDAEVECLTVQLATLELLDDAATFDSYISGLITGAADPENQYWNNPNRHW